MKEVIFAPEPCSWQCLLLPEGAHCRAVDVGLLLLPWHS